MSGRRDRDGDVRADAAPVTESRTLPTGIAAGRAVVSTARGLAAPMPGDPGLRLTGRLRSVDSRAARAVVHPLVRATSALVEPVLTRLRAASAGID